MPHKPAWFRDGQVFVSYAPTVGINKDGEELFVVDSATGQRTGVIDNQLHADVQLLREGSSTSSTSRWVDRGDLSDRLVAVPIYYDQRPLTELNELMRRPEMEGFTTAAIGDLIQSGQLVSRAGHGSPSADLRRGTIPYIKVSDIRAGQININPTNRVSDVVARRFWRGDDSGLNEFDLVTPIRTSKNIGEFALLMPGQEHVVLTKEVLVLRAGPDAQFDNFYLLWAMTLKAVRHQWDRVVFMQTNREDVGERYKEIELPVPPDRETADSYSAPFREFYVGTQQLRERLLNYLSNDSKHYIFMSSAVVEPDDEDEDVSE